MLLFIYSNAQELSENKVKAVFVYNFTRFIDWPVTAYNSPAAPFVIGILGEDPFENYLEEAISGENIENHPIVIKHFKNTNEIKDCHILYINSEDGENVKADIKDIGNKSILTVSDVKNFTSMGGMIRLYTEKDKIKIQINSIAAKAAQLEISAKLLSVAQTF